MFMEAEGRRAVVTRRRRRGGLPMGVPGVRRAAPGGGSVNTRWQVFVVTALGVFMVYLDGTIVNIAFPAIGTTFAPAPPTELSWVLNAYSIVFAALLLGAGQLADRLGRRRLFFVGLSVFTLGSVL